MREASQQVLGLLARAEEPSLLEAQALALAGGLSERGSTRGIKIQRVVNGKKQEISVKDINTDLVRAGDTINVPARFF